MEDQHNAVVIHGRLVGVGLPVTPGGPVVIEAAPDKPEPKDKEMVTIGSDAPKAKFFGLTF